MAHTGPNPSSSRPLRTRDLGTFRDTLHPNAIQLSIANEIIDGSRLLAGPQLHTSQPPHQALGGSFTHPNGGNIIVDTPPGWIRAPAGNELWNGWINRHGHTKAIQLLVEPENVPNGNTIDQREVNYFTRRLQDSIRLRVGSSDHKDAPYVVQGEVSSSNDGNRRREFEWSTRVSDGGVPTPFINGTDMKLGDYSVTVPSAARIMNRSKGTLALTASRDSIAPSENIIMRRLANYIPGLDAKKIDDYTKQQQEEGKNVALWHNTAVLAVKIAAGTHREVRGVYIYDPSFVNENQSRRRVSLSIQQNNTAGRLGDHLLIGNAARLAREWRASRDSVYIGGGSNSAGVDECRVMCCNWLQQVASLLCKVAEEQLNAGEDEFKERREWKDAVDDLRAFLQNFYMVTI